MKKIISLGFFILVFMSIGGNAMSGSNLISYQIIEKTSKAPFKESFAIRVDLIGSRLPNEQELGSISRKLIHGNFDRAFVNFFLPGMATDAGSFATAHHNPTMEVKFTLFSLIQYPKYEHFLGIDLSNIPD